MMRKAGLSVMINKYTIKKFKGNILKALSLVKSSTILGHYKNCLKKMYLYRKK